MKRIILFVLVFFVAGCSSNYLENPKYFLQDPKFDEYQTKKDSVETRYLNKEITYAEYLEALKELDQDYSKTAQEGEAALSGERIISSDQPISDAVIR